MVHVLTIVLCTAGLLLALGLLLRRGLRARSSHPTPSNTPPPAFRARVAVDIDTSQLTTPRFIHQGTPYVLVVDTETFDAIPDEPEIALQTFSPAVALSWQILDRGGNCLGEYSHILRRSGMMADDAIDLHGISNDAMHRGEDPRAVYSRLLADAQLVECIAAHNLAFHLGTICEDLHRLAIPDQALRLLSGICTMEHGRSMGFKRYEGRALYPRLDELFAWCYFGRLNIELSYTSKTLRDVRLVAACLNALRLLG